ncbi:hypothetical protein AB0953_29140 [Streptomyces sp. NPDC046866]|uniref:hypothetical protein n=1 Tax=Streptomyces sp. NPDC046866 TaxID=3154921 RepID=UPI003455BFC0
MAENAAPDLFSGLAASASGAAAAIRAQAKALAVDYETLSGYKNVVDELLKKLNDSQADDKKLAHGTLPKGALGKGFAEADALFKTYETVQTQLENLSKNLAGQIEGLGIAIQTSGKGYAEMDEEQKRRMAQIAKQAKHDYDPDRDPLNKQQQKEHKDAQPGTAGEANKPKGKI